MFGRRSRFVPPNLVPVFGNKNQGRRARGVAAKARSAPQQVDSATTPHAPTQTGRFNADRTTKNERKHNDANKPPAARSRRSARLLWHESRAGAGCGWGDVHRPPQGALWSGRRVGLWQIDYGNGDPAL